MNSMGRQRSAKNKNLPVGLYSKAVNGEERWYYRKKDGKETYFPRETTLDKAIEAVLLYNQKHRTSIEAILETKDRFNIKISDVWSDIEKTISKERAGTARSSMKTLLNDLERFHLFFGKQFSKSISRGHVSEYLDKYHGASSNNVRNRKLSFLQTVFEELMDKGYMDENPAKLLKFRKKESKKRKRLFIETFNKILKAAPTHVKVAMQLALQTTHGAAEISNMRYDDCEFFDTPLLWDIKSESYVNKDEAVDETLVVYGMLKIKRKKNQTKAASAVKIPITAEIKKVIDESKADGIESPYIVHKAKKPTNKKRCEKTGKFVTKVPLGCSHVSQVPSQDISKEFSAIRDALNLTTLIENPDYDCRENRDAPEFIEVRMESLNPRERPSFHEIRALALFLLEEDNTEDEIKDDTSARAAHSEKSTTKIYLTGREKWNTVKPAIVKAN
ncbi:hypothetical protein [uncultured Pseudoalteromonas sp.]|uniref:hypothetical protein n=1 Tax=uncultured Pseudoalteromonas sp. TaxID=114053 RepID=UPI0025975459|nr:hypothetical protein [uncultured Pseudoalteromonas sp.]